MRSRRDYPRLPLQSGAVGDVQSSRAHPAPAAISWKRLADRLGIRSRVSILLVAVAIPFVFLLIIGTIRDYRKLETGLRAQTQQLATLAANNQNEVIEQTRQLLEALATDSRIRTGDWPRCGTMLADFLAQFRESHSNFVVADLHGDIVCSGVPLAKPVNIADIRDFREVFETRQFVVGDLVLARTTSTWVVLLRTPVIDEDGGLIAAVSAPVPVERFAAAAANLSLRQKSELLVVDRGGRVIANMPPARRVGELAAKAPIVSAMLEHRVGVAELSGADGVHRVYAFAAAGPAARPGIHIAVGIPRAELARELDRELAVNLLAVLATTVCVLAAAFWAVGNFMGRKLDVIVTAAARIRAGDMSARTGLHGAKEEINQLGETFDLMAQALQEREVELKLALREMEELSITDPLTGLFNRRYLFDLLGREMLKAARNGRPVAAIMMDIDHFKRFNDTWGHEAGDFVLKRVADVIRETVRATDIACRYGGEELTVILPEATLDIAMERAETLRRSMEALSLTHSGRALGTVTLSFGVALYPDHAADPEGLLRAADAALYEAKHAGRNRVLAATGK